MQSTGQVKQLIGLTEDIKDRTVVVIEDIIDSGLTMQQLLANLNDHQPAELHIAALLVKPDNLQVPLKLDYTASKSPMISSLATDWTTMDTAATCPPSIQS